MTNEDDAPEMIVFCPECRKGETVDYNNHIHGCHQSGKKKPEYILKSVADKEAKELRDRVGELEGILIVRNDYEKGLEQRVIKSGGELRIAKRKIKELEGLPNEQNTI